MNEEKVILSKDNFIHNSIKDAFLQLLLKKDYMQITITDLCKYAGVSRGTFYTHFGNIGQVVEEVFSDALYDIKNMALLSENGSSSNIIVRKGLCWFLRENPKYQPLFFSEALFLPAVKHTVVALKQDFLDVMLDKTGLDESTLTDLLTVQIMGCLEMCRKHLGKSDEEWCRFHTCFDLFLKAGYEGIIQNNNA